MKNLTATYHTLDFNLLSPDKFAHFCFWRVDDSGEYEDIEFYDGKADKQRDVIGYLNEDKTELDYFQCKKNKNPVFSLLKSELDELLRHINNGEIKMPRKLYFVLSTAASPEAKDDTKKYAKSINLPEPIFWEPVYLDKKIKKDKEALKNFFNISETEDKKMPQIDITGQIAYGTDDYRVTIVNNGDVPAIDCNIYLVGFGLWYKTPSKIDLNPQQQKEVRLGVPGDFMKLDPFLELRVRFEYRDSTTNWYYSERLLETELVPSKAFYRIKADAGDFHPAEKLAKFTINAISVPGDNVSIAPARDVYFTYKNKAMQLRIKFGGALVAWWKFSADQLEYAFKELAMRKIETMIKNDIFENEFELNAEMIHSPMSEFESYQYLRDSIV